MAQNRNRHWIHEEDDIRLCELLAPCAVGLILLRLKPSRGGFRAYMPIARRKSPPIRAGSVSEFSFLGLLAAINFGRN